MLGCTGINHATAFALFQHNFNQYIVSEVTLNRTYNAKAQCYWSVNMRARIGTPFIWSKANMKTMSTYFHTYKPGGLVFVGIVESIGGNYEGGTSFFRVASCNCGTFFLADETTFPSEGQWLNNGTHIYIHALEFMNTVKEIFTNHDNFIYIHNEETDELSDSEDEDDPTGLCDAVVAGLQKNGDSVSNRLVSGGSIHPTNLVSDGNVLTHLVDTQQHQQQTNMTQQQQQQLNDRVTMLSLTN